MVQSAFSTREFIVVFTRRPLPAKRSDSAATTEGHVITDDFFRDPMSDTYALRVRDDATRCLVW